MKCFAFAKDISDLAGTRQNAARHSKHIWQTGQTPDMCNVPQVLMAFPAFQW